MRRSRREIEREQHNFDVGRSTIDLIIVTRQIQEKS